ncbi:Protein C24G6.2 a [Aphelenchoides avenae]|nr:Protein C24G6.2 a [Aphelenchus avenae]
MKLWVTRTFQGNLQQCNDKCQRYANADLCTDDVCWRKCDDLTDSKDAPPPPSPKNLKAEFNPAYGIDLDWSPVAEPAIYVVRYGSASVHLWRLVDQIAKEPNIRNFTLLREKICEKFAFRVAAVTATGGVGTFSPPYELDPPKPLVQPKMKLVSMTLEKRPFDSDDYHANGTIEVVLGYSPPSWPLGDDDLEVSPTFHMLVCKDPDMSQAVPVAQFRKGKQAYTVETEIGSDMMYRQCKFIYAVDSVKSKKCDTSTNVHATSSDIQGLEISCHNVQNSDCYEVPRYPAPRCGQINQFNYELVDEKSIDWNDRAANISVEVTFKPQLRPSEKNKALYWVALYGEAEHFGTDEDRVRSPLIYKARSIKARIAGVNMTSVLGKVTNCLNFSDDGHCEKQSGPSMIIPDLNADTLYGVMICAVMDPRNVTFPKIGAGTVRDVLPRTEKLLIDSTTYKKSNAGLVWGIVGGLASIVLVACCAGLVFWTRRQQDKIKKKALHGYYSQNGDDRYRDFNKKSDLWELERRNLIIYDEQKLGAGAFGAVYKGKLIGVARGSKDAQSTLGVNLMRVENCEVAVKMLPEYADELSKSDFLREISLMKSLGYHERLVNMLACITESEPYCLIVEYCSDGDLLQFLRARCNYMLQLDEQGVNYLDPGCGVDFDREMVMTLRQLLMFSVQVSYGLEYLSQKGFVHRDVAARNVLVNQKTQAKIGDFGLCRHVSTDSDNYQSRGGRLPIKWMAPESIRHYVFTNKTDVWSFGVLMFEIITLGGTPYPGIQPDDMLAFLESGGRMPKPDNCSDEFYSTMKSCWCNDPEERPDFSAIRQLLARQLEEITDEYSYLKLDAGKDYYNVSYRDQASRATLLSKHSDEVTIPLEPANRTPSDASDRPLVIEEQAPAEVHTAQISVQS